VQEYVAKEQRRTKGAAEFNLFMEICDSPKWKLFKQRPDTETWTAKDANLGFHAIKICGAVRTSMQSLQDYVHAHHLIVSAPPNFVRGGVVKVHDECHSDFLVTYKSDAKFGTARDFFFCKRDQVLPNRTVSVAWCLENQRKSSDFTPPSAALFSLSPPSSSSDPSSGPRGFCKSICSPALDPQRKSVELSSLPVTPGSSLVPGPRGVFKATGCIVQPLPENPLYCWLVLVFNLDRKIMVNTDNMDLYLYRTLQRVRTDTESPDNNTPLSDSGEIHPPPWTREL